MKRFLETLILRSEFSEIIAPFSNARNRSYQAIEGFQSAKVKHSGYLRFTLTENLKRVFRLSFGMQ
jgi:hypothetical protein